MTRVKPKWTPKHTPGPWTVPHFASERGKCECGYVFSQYQRGMGAICEVLFDHGQECGGEQEDRATATANAHLIASAPDLLAALTELVRIRDSAEGPHHRVQSNAWTAARAAIANATGRSPF